MRVGFSEELVVGEYSQTSCWAVMEGRFLPQRREPNRRSPSSLHSESCQHLLNEVGREQLLTRIKEDSMESG